MVYQVCALVLTLIIGMAGLYFLMILHSTRLLADEARKTLEIINGKIPGILSEIENSAQELRITSGLVQTGIKEVSASIDNLRSPVKLASQLILVIREILTVWNRFKGRKEENAVN